VSAAFRGRRSQRPELWGWHRLADSWADLLVADSGVGSGDLVVDVGAGTGALTAALADAGARVIAVEKHPGRARRLRERFAHRDVTVLEIDLADFRFPARPFSVVANPPFALTSTLMRVLTGRRSPLRSATLVLQRSAARRWAS
jgi:23S rRNA (adenine-N6)-dimethyltransferase